MESLRTAYIRLIQDLHFNTYRELYRSFTTKNRLAGIIGPRGTGKTTLMLQYIKNKIKDTATAFYVTLDHIYFNNNTLYEFVQSLFENEGITTFFLDEVHKYENWDQELKNIYDYFPKVKIIFSGSSSMELKKGMHDLSRRCVIHKLRGLSFREYLHFKTGKAYSMLSFDDIIKNHIDISYELSQIPRIKGHFSDYLKQGYYPFIFEGEDYYYQRINTIIEKTIYEDIANLYQIKSENLRYFKKILYFLCTIPPGELNIHKLAKNVAVDDKTIQSYMHIMSETDMITLLYPAGKGSVILKKPEKMLVENPSLYHAVCHEIDSAANTGTLRELFFINSLQIAGLQVRYSRSIGDYRCSQYNFEIGGRGKTKKQIKSDLNRSFVVKDDILVGSRNIIPLYLFGFLG